MTAPTPAPSASTRTANALSWKSTAVATAIAAVGALIINSVIAWVGRGLLDVPTEFRPLSPSAYGPLTVIGALAGAIGWHLIAAHRRRASHLLNRLVPVVLVLSLIPDVLLLADKSMQPGTTTAGVITLMLMHIGVAAVAVPTYRRFIPPRS